MSYSLVLLMDTESLTKEMIKRNVDKLRADGLRDEEILVLFRNALMNAMGMDLGGR